MKRQIVILGIITVSILFLANCEKEKDMNGIPIKYYENVIGEGYVFEKHSDGTITPYISFYDSTAYPFHIEAWVRISAEEKQNDPYINDIDNCSHLDYIKVDNNGKYTCRFLEKKRPNVWAWEWKKMSFYTIWSAGFTSNRITYTYETIQEVAKKATKENPQIVQIDTIWVNW